MTTPTPAHELLYVVEDDAITATLTKLLLEKHLRGGRVQTYTNGQRAFDQLRQALQAGSDEVPDLILLDLNMPQMDGWEFLDAFAELSITRAVGVLILTSSINPEDRARASRYRNVAGYFAKPLEPDMVAEILRRRRAAAGPTPQVPASPQAGLHRLVYQSRATALLDEAGLAELLAQSRAFNAAHNLTGVLLYSQGHIVQLLEGPAAAVHAVYERIARDVRHTGVATLADGPITHRLLAQWSMGFKAVGSADYALLTGYVNPDGAGSLMDDLARLDPDLHLLLTTFVTEKESLF